MCLAMGVLVGCVGMLGLDNEVLGATAVGSIWCTNSWQSAYKSGCRDIIYFAMPRQPLLCLVLVNIVAKLRNLLRQAVRSMNVLQYRQSGEESLAAGCPSDHLSCSFLSNRDQDS